MIIFLYTLHPGSHILCNMNVCEKFTIVCRDRCKKIIVSTKLRSYVGRGVIDIRLVLATARDSRANVIRTCEILLIRFNYGSVIPIVRRFESHRHECASVREVVNPNVARNAKINGRADLTTKRFVINRPISLRSFSRNCSENLERTWRT